MRKTTSTIVAASAVAIATAVCTPPETAGQTPTPPLLGVEVAEERSASGLYNQTIREHWGEHSPSVEHELAMRLGFDQPHNESTPWTVVTPYTCTTMQTDGRNGTQIEHIVALQEAVESGLSPYRLPVFANDLDNLTLVTPTANRSKGAKDAGGTIGYVPPHNKRWFARRVLTVKRKYGLTIDAAERHALAGLLAGANNPCPAN